MKLRRRRKEEGGRTTIVCSATTQPGRSQSSRPLPFPLLFSFSLIIPFSSSPAPPTYLLLRPSLSAATCRESNILQLSLHQLFCFSLLLHKITEVVERGGRGIQLAGPAVLPNDNMWRAQFAAPLPLHPIGWPRFSSALMASSLWRVEP